MVVAIAVRCGDDGFKCNKNRDDLVASILIYVVCIPVSLPVSFTVTTGKCNTAVLVSETPRKMRPFWLVRTVFVNILYIGRGFSCCRIEP